MEWQSAPDIVAWVEASRAQSREGARSRLLTRPRWRICSSRFVTALFPALAKLEEFAAHAHASERARMFQPVA